MTTRPTKKQYELLQYLSEFIAEHGYSPSYREIMRGCNYTSVATVALHVKNLIARGHVVKRGTSARSLEVVGTIEHEKKKKDTKHTSSNSKNELVAEIEKRFKVLETLETRETAEKESNEDVLNELYVLVGALKILGSTDVARAYTMRINTL